MIDLKKGLTGLVIGLVIIMFAIDIIVLVRGIFPFVYLLTINLVIIGALLYINSMYVRASEDKTYYSVWGFLFALIGVSIAVSSLTGDWLFGVVTFIAGIGLIIIYTSFKK